VSSAYAYLGEAKSAFANLNPPAALILGNACHYSRPSPNALNARAKHIIPISTSQVQLACKRRAISVQNESKICKINLICILENHYESTSYLTPVFRCTDDGSALLAVKVVIKQWHVTLTPFASANYQQTLSDTPVFVLYRLPVCPIKS
jgi:hypothetical protein